MNIIRNGFRFRSIRSNFFLTGLVFITFLSFFSYHNSINDESSYIERAIPLRNNFAGSHLNIMSDIDELESNKAEVQHLLERNNLKNYKSMYTSMRKPKSSPEKYLILEYTNVFFKPKFCDKKPEEIFNSEFETCEYTNCDYTCDKIDHLSKADALIFHQRDLEAEFERSKKKFENWFKTTKQFPFKTIEQKLQNNPDQVWILWNDEATSIDQNFNSISPFFNWTLSYKTNAEIFEGSYGYFKKNTDLTEENAAYYKSEILRNFAQRQNAILWFVSNCKSKSREKIALEISRYYPVHIYGKCDLSDQISDEQMQVQYPYLKIFGDNELCKRGSQCEDEKFKSYKYYLAFENRNCSDYITEKVWKAFNKNLIPIVFQPSRDSYRRFSIPSKSLIHLEDFENDIKKMTDYLAKIDLDFNFYLDHVKWTFMYLRTIDDPKQTEPHRMCQLCKQLNTMRDKISYDKISNFFNEKCSKIY
ncbi:glyco 3-alpha-L-fucosyltransferase A-like isoform X1 [Brachionus plicatilis]|uniref:Fucosyltransferase n=1 Tax=Brachionus plicatilis TaxID=10195 RepID=A0A3M7RBQ0_BRAPC|nr:glyco 3-alpha-L-fucosyltransferase A-like isoform X1 [Brachionus plicatilis]